jgi:hypothetical protein
MLDPALLRPGRFDRKVSALLHLMSPGLYWFFQGTPRMNCWYCAKIVFTHQFTILCFTFFCSLVWWISSDWVSVTCCLL